MSSQETTAATAAPVPRERMLKIYDFKRPDKFTKDEIHTVYMMHETLARQASNVLSSMLRTTAHVRCALVDQMTYEEFIRSIPSPATIAVLAMEPLKGAAIMELDPAVSSAMVERLFGGIGRASAKNRELTDIECGILEGAITRLLGPFREAWATILDLQPRLLAIETNPGFAQIVAPTEMIVLAGLEAQVGEARGFINICLPYLTIEPIILKLSVQAVYASHRPAAAGPNAAASSLPMSAEVCYEGERLSVTALLRMRKGTLVRVPRFAAGDAFLQAGGSAVLGLSAQGQQGGGVVTYAVAAPQAGRDLAALGAGPSAPDRADDPLRDALQALSAEVGAGMKGLEGKIAELVHRQEELVDQLALPSSGKEPSSPEDAGARKRPFGFLAMSYCETLARFLGQEHPQLVALVLSYLEPGLAACVLEAVPQEMRVDITERICTIGRVSPEVMREVERILEKKLAAIDAWEVAAAGGVGAVVEILNVATRGLEKFVVESMEKSSPELAEEIKKRMFVFEDIVLLTKETLAAVLAEVKQEDLLLSLKAVSPSVRDYVWQCMPGPKASALQAALEKAGPARLFDVNAAQQRIVAVIRVMEEEGKIIVARPGDLVQ